MVAKASTDENGKLKPSKLVSLIKDTILEQKN
jgi:hypothetical protein